MLRTDFTPQSQVVSILLKDLNVVGKTYVNRVFPLSHMLYCSV